MDACNRAIEHMRGKGLACYPPGVKLGTCKSPYVVVCSGGSYAQGVSGGTSISRRIVTLYCYVPRTTGNLEALVANVKAELKALRPQLMPTGNEGPEIIEQDYDARSQSIEYQVMRAEL